MKQKIPVITGYSLNVPVLLKSLQAKGIKATFKNTRADKTLIFAESIEDHGKIFALIKEQGLTATTSTPQSLRTQSLIIRGLHRETDAVEILAERKAEHPQLKIRPNQALLTPKP